MNELKVGSTAPSFRLRSGQGEEIGPEDYRGRENLIVWFTKGMGCPFCRHQMSQLARGYPQFKTMNAEILEVTVTPPDRAKFYVEKFRIPFPYLSDPDYQARRAWGLDVRSHSIFWYAKIFYRASKMAPPPDDFGEVKTPLSEFPDVMRDDDRGFFIVDRQGVIRFALGGRYATEEEGPRPIPSNEEILHELERCESAARS